MIFKRVSVFVTLFSVALCLNLEFEEDGSRYDEKISIDDSNNTVEYDVPQHGRVQASKYLNDYALGYTVMKVDLARECYAMDMPKDEPTPAQVRLGLKKVNGTFPLSNFWVSKKILLPLYEIERSQLSQSIRTFCGNYPVIKVLKADSLKEMEKMVQEYALGRSNGMVTKHRRAVTVEFFFNCKKPGNFNPTCPPDKLNIRCKIVRPGSCVYKIKCLQKNDYSGWSCDIPEHHFSSITCCEYLC